MFSISYLFELNQIWADRLQHRDKELESHPNYNVLKTAANYKYAGKDIVRQLPYIKDNVTKSIKADRALAFIDKKREQARHLSKAIELKHEQKKPENKSPKFLDRVYDDIKGNTVAKQLKFAHSASQNARELYKSINDQPNKFTMIKKVLHSVKDEQQ